MLQKKTLAGFWSIVFDKANRGIEEKWYIRGGSSSREKICCEVPGCWNFVDRERYFHYTGTAWYFKTFAGSPDWRGKRVLLVFEGVHYRCQVWLNEKKVGEHEGGFTPFEIDVSNIINPVGKNYLAVQVNNELSETTLPSLGVDWFNYGGIVREVYVGVTNQLYIANIRVDTRINGTVNVEFNLVNQDSSIEEVTYTVTIYDMDGNPQAVHTAEIRVKNQEKIACQLTVKNPQLWDTRNPYLYRMEIIVQNQDKTYLIDKTEESVGIREIKTEGIRILLNRRPIKIRGVSRHEDYPHVGRTISRHLTYQDYSIIKKANVNLVRLAHYPHSREEIEVADHLGIMLMEEIPNVFLRKEQMAKPNVLKLAKQQLKEVIESHRNHPSVVMWSLSIECETDTEIGREYMKKLAEYARQLDKTRLLIHASNRPLKEKAYDLVDVIGVNIFEGWYSQKPLKVYGEWMDEAHEKLPDKPIVLTSHGAGAIYGNRRLEETYWSENYQAKYLKEIGEMLLKRDYISGEIIWHFMDFPVSHWEQLGFTKMLNYLMRPVEFNHKGLVDYYRRPKMSYYVVRDLYKRWQEKEEARNKSQMGGEEA